MRWLAIGLLTIVLAGTAVAATGPAAGSAAFLADRQSANGGFAEQGRVPDAPLTAWAAFQRRRGLGSAADLGQRLIDERP